MAQYVPRGSTSDAVTGEDAQEDVQVAVPTSFSSEADHVGDSETAGHGEGEGEHGGDGDDTGR